MFNIEKVSSSGINMEASITRPNDTTAYTALDVVGTTMTFTASTAIPPSCHFIIMGASLRVDVNAVPSGMGSFRLHLYSSSPTTIADNSAYNLIVADRPKYLGYIEFETPVDIGDTLYIQKENINMKRNFATDSISIFGVLQTVNGFTPSALTVKTIKLHAVQA